MPKDQVNANCKLCGTHGPLRESHILPKWTYRRIMHPAIGGGENKHPVRVTNDNVVMTSRQLWDHLLCGACEQLFSRDENTVAQIALAPDDSFRARELAVAVPDLGQPGFQAVDVSAVDCDALARFAVSVIWRASVSVRVPKVSLGPYSAPLATYLLGRDPFPDHAVLFVEIFQPVAEGWRFDRVMAAPHSVRRDRYHVHKFALFGFAFHLGVGAEVPSSLKSDLCLVRTKRAVLSDGKPWKESLEASAIKALATPSARRVSEKLRGSK